MPLIIKFKVKVAVFKPTTFLREYQGAAEKEKLGHYYTMRY